MNKGAAQKTGGRTLHSLWIILAFTGFALTATTAPAQQLHTASLTPGNAILREADLPAVLTAGDITRYRRIFALQQSNNWQEADREIAGLRDRLLLGEVLSQRYRAPSYATSYGELVAWLNRYGDEPDAKAIYALALKKHPADAAPPPRPSGLAASIDSDDDDVSPVPAASAGRQLQTLLPADAHRAEHLQQQINDLAARDPRRAELLLASREAKLLIDSDTRDDLRAISPRASRRPR